LVGAFTLGWRWASRRWSLPCPSLLTWTLDSSLVVQSPLTLKTLDRIGFRPGEKVLEIGPGPGRTRRRSPVGHHEQDLSNEVSEDWTRGELSWTS